MFISTNAAYKLRNLGCRQVVLVGGLTDQCIDSAARDACDLGFLVTVVTDGCITHSAERHTYSLSNNGGYARQRTTAQVMAELSPPGAPPPLPPAPCREVVALWSVEGTKPPVAKYSTSSRGHMDAHPDTPTRVARPRSIRTRATARSATLCSDPHLAIPRRTV